MDAHRGQCDAIMQPQKYTAFAGTGKKPDFGFTVSETIAANQLPAMELPAAAK